MSDPEDFVVGEQLSLVDMPRLPYEHRFHGAEAPRNKPNPGTLRWDVLMALAEQDRTDLELQAHLGMGGNTERPRRDELREDGWIEDSGRRRRLESGELSIVWTLTEGARKALAR